MCYKSYCYYNKKYVYPIITIMVKLPPAHIIGFFSSNFLKNFSIVALYSCLKSKRTNLLPALGTYVAIK